MRKENKTYSILKKNLPKVEEWCRTVWRPNFIKDWLKQEYTNKLITEDEEHEKGGE